MKGLIEKIVKDGCLLNEEIVGIGRGSYLLTSSLFIRRSDEGYIYVVKYDGSPYSSENESVESRAYESEIEAAKAAIRRFEIINVTPGGGAVFAPKIRQNK